MSGSKHAAAGHRGGEGYKPPAGIFPAPEAPGEIFGQNVFTKAVMQTAVAQAGVQVGDGHHRALKPLDPTVADVVAVGHEGLGDGEGRHPLRPRLLPADRADRREARQLPRARRRRLVRSPSSPARRSPRASPTPPASPTAACAPPSRPAATPAGTSTSPAYILENPNGNTLCIPTVVRVDDRRGARQQDAAAALAAGHGRAGRSAS